MERKQARTFLFSLVEPNPRKVFRIEKGILSIESPFGSNAYKKTYDVFVEAYTSQGPLTRLRSFFHRVQANLYRPNHNVFQRILSKLSTPVPTIFSYGNFLDVGCNTGAFLSKIPDPWKRYGVEVNAEAVKQSEQYRNITVFHNALEQMETSHKFSFVRMSHVVEHVLDEDSFLKALNRSMESGGYALLYTPNTRSLSSWLFGKYWGGFYEKTHVKLFNLANLRQLCERHGFQVVEDGTYYMGMTADCLTRVLGMTGKGNLGMFTFGFFFLLFYPFSFLVNAVKLGGAMYMYVRKTN